MHELSICHGIMEVALAALPVPPPPVHSVTVRIGRLTAVVPDSLRFYWDLLSAGTPLEGATLAIEEVPIRGRCGECAAAFQVETLAFSCPGCGSGLVELVSGRELQVVALETVGEVSCGS